VLEAESGSAKDAHERPNAENTLREEWRSLRRCRAAGFAVDDGGGTWKRGAGVNEEEAVGSHRERGPAVRIPKRGSARPSVWAREAEANARIQVRGGMEYNNDCSAPCFAKAGKESRKSPCRFRCHPTREMWAARADIDRAGQERGASARHYANARHRPSINTRTRA